MIVQGGDNIRRLFHKEPINIKCNIHSFRKYGQPKLDKPKELKGIKQALSVDYIPNKCKCQVFVLGDDVWVKHGDYFSPSMKVEEIGAPLDYLVNKYTDKTKGKKFVYGDAWGDIIERQEAWIRIDNLMSEINSGKFELDIVNEIRSQQEKYHGFDEYELCCSDMERFWEKLVNGLKKEVCNV